MKPTDDRQDPPRRPERPQPAATAPPAGTPSVPAHARVVDPYEMRTEPSQEEPGYGHGV